MGLGGLVGAVVGRGMRVRVVEWGQNTGGGWICRNAVSGAASRYLGMNSSVRLFVRSYI